MFCRRVASPSRSAKVEENAPNKKKTKIIQDEANLQEKVHPIPQLKKRKENNNFRLSAVTTSDKKTPDFYFFPLSKWK